jgi:hypothetical protein
MEVLEIYHLLDILINLGSLWITNGNLLLSLDISKYDIRPRIFSLKTGISLISSIVIFSTSLFFTIFNNLIISLGLSPKVAVNINTFKYFNDFVE